MIFFVVVVPNVSSDSLYLLQIPRLLAFSWRCAKGDLAVQLWEQKAVQAGRSCHCQCKQNLFGFALLIIPALQWWRCCSLLCE